MVRETRHLWVGNLPDNIREERIREHFKRYGKVQSVKIRRDADGVCATVSFIDLRSAAKAHVAENKLDERLLKTEYYEPAATGATGAAPLFQLHEEARVPPTSGAAPGPPPPPSATVAPPGAPYAVQGPARNPRFGDERAYYYDRAGDPYVRRAAGYHDEDGYQSRGRSRDRYARSAASNASAYTDGVDRCPASTLLPGQYGAGSHFRSHGVPSRQPAPLPQPTHFDPPSGYGLSPASEPYPDDKDSGSPSAVRGGLPVRRGSAVSSTVTSPPQQQQPPLQPQSQPPQQRCHNKHGSRSQSRSRSSSRSSSGSRLGSSSSKIRSSSSDSSGRSLSPNKSPTHPSSVGSKASRGERPASAVTAPSSGSFLQSAISTPNNSCSIITNNNSSSSGNCLPTTNSLDGSSLADREDKRPLGICVRNLPVRSTDTSLKDGLFHEYKKHGKVTVVKVIGQGTERYAVVCFKKPEDVEKALEVSKDKLFFGCKIEVTSHEGLDGEDNEFRPLEAELDEYHPKATRTLFIGNLEKDITTSELRKHFDQFGDIIEIDIKKQGSASSYAFIQYADIASVVKAMRKLDGENLGANRIKLGFGKSMPTMCVWLDGLTDLVSDKFLSRTFGRYGPVSFAAIDRERGHALVYFDSLECAQHAVAEMRGRVLGGKKLQVDFASRECQTAFFDKIEMSGQVLQGERPWERRDRRQEFDVIRDERFPRDGRGVAFDGRGYGRYEAQQRSAGRGPFRGLQRGGGAYNSRGRGGQPFQGRYDGGVYHDEFGERRHRFPEKEDGLEEITPYDERAERLKHIDGVLSNADWAPRKTSSSIKKHRNSTSDQESHHSQSPPQSRHHSRSPPPSIKGPKKGSSKERSSQRHRLSPGRSSSRSPVVRDVALDPDDLFVDIRDMRRRSLDGGLKCETKELPLASVCSKLEAFQDAGPDRIRSSSMSRLRRDEDIHSTSDSPSQLERKRRLLGLKDGGSRPEDSRSDTDCAEGDEDVAARADGKYLAKQVQDILSSSDGECSPGADGSTRKKGLPTDACAVAGRSRQAKDIPSVVSKRLPTNCRTAGSFEAKFTVEVPGVKVGELLQCMRKQIDLDPRRQLDHNKVSSTVSSYLRAKKAHSDKLDLCAGGDRSKLCDPSLVSSTDSEVGSQDASLLVHLASRHGEEGIDEVSSSSDNPTRTRPFREPSPLSLPLPKFAAALRSPKTSPCVAASPMANSQSPRGNCSPLSALNTKNGPMFPEALARPEKPPEEKPVEVIPDIVPEALSPSPSPKGLKGPSEPKLPESSSDSEGSLPSPNVTSFDEQIRALDEKYNAITGPTRTFTGPSTASSVAVETPVPVTIDYNKYNIKKRPRFPALSQEFRAEPSEIMKTLLAKTTILDQDSKRLEHINEKYEPKDVKLELSSSSTKPLFRTKAAAKEFSTPLSLPSLGFSSCTPAAASALPQGASSPCFTHAASSTALGAASSGQTVPTCPSQGTAGQAVAAPAAAATPESHAKHTPPSAVSYGEASPRTVPPSILRRDSSPPCTVKQEPFQSPPRNLTPLSPPAAVKKEVVSPRASALLRRDSSPPVGVKQEPFQSPPQTPAPLLPLAAGKKEPGIESLSSRKDSRSRDTCAVKVESAAAKEVVIKKEPHKDTVKKEFRKEHQSSKNTPREHHPTLVDAPCNSVLHKERRDSHSHDSTDLPAPLPLAAVKRRVSSVDSNESDSAKSSRSSDAYLEVQPDGSWQRSESERRSVEPDAKRPRLSSHSSRERDSFDKSHSSSKLSSSSHSKKPEKRLEKSSSSSSSSFKSERTEKSHSSSSLKTEPGDKQDAKQSSESKRESSKNKEDKKSSKSRDGREKSRDRPKEKDSSKDKGQDVRHGCSSSHAPSSSSSSSSRPRKEHGSERSDKDKSRSEKQRTSSMSEQSRDSKSKSKSKSESNSAPAPQASDFCFLDDEPVYFSMYDKVKARSSQNQTLKDQANMETMRQKFSRLKQSRAKKGKSADMDSDRDSDLSSHHSSDSETKSRISSHKAKQLTKKRKLIIESSSDDNGQSFAMRLLHNKDDDSSDFCSDSEVESFKEAFNKCKERKVDISDVETSDSDEISRAIAASRKQKRKQRHSSEKSTKSRHEKSDIESSDADIGRSSKRKELKKKSARKASILKSDADGSDEECQVKMEEPDRSSKPKPTRQEEVKPETPRASKETASSHSSSGSKSKRPSKDTDESKHEEDAESRQRHSSKKRKKSKKSSKLKEKKSTEKGNSTALTPSSHKRSDAHWDVGELLDESSVSSKYIGSPKQTLNSPPVLQPSIFSDVEMKSELSDYDFEPSTKLKEKTKDQHHEESWNSKHNVSCELSPVSDIKQEREDPVEVKRESDSELDKIVDALSEAVEPCNATSEEYPDTNKMDEYSMERVPYDDVTCDVPCGRHLSDDDDNNKEEAPSRQDEQKSKEHKKKKKQSKEKKRKHKDEPVRSSSPVPEPPEEPAPAFPTALDEDSKLTEDIRLDEDIAEEARRLEEELLAQSEETSTFGDGDSLSRREEKPLQAERHFEEEAAKETKRLEEELFSSGRDSWHMKDEKVYDEVAPQKETKALADALEVSSVKDSSYSSLVAAEELPSRHSASPHYLPHDVPEQFKIDDKEQATYELDSPRKMEDDLAVYALLQEMGNDGISAPELPKEPDYLDPMVQHHEQQHEESMSFLLPDESSSSLQIDTSMPDLTQDESRESGGAVEFTDALQSLQQHQTQQQQQPQQHEELLEKVAESPAQQSSTGAIAEEEEPAKDASEPPLLMDAKEPEPSTEPPKELPDLTKCALQQPEGQTTSTEESDVAVTTKPGKQKVKRRRRQSPRIEDASRQLLSDTDEEHHFVCGTRYEPPTESLETHPFELAKEELRLAAASSAVASAEEHTGDKAELVTRAPLGSSNDEPSVPEEHNAKTLQVTKQEDSCDAVPPLRPSMAPESKVEPLPTEPGEGSHEGEASGSRPDTLHQMDVPIENDSSKDQEMFDDMSHQAPILDIIETLSSPVAAGDAQDGEQEDGAHHEGDSSGEQHDSTLSAEETPAHLVEQAAAGTEGTKRKTGSRKGRKTKSRRASVPRLEVADVPKVPAKRGRATSADKVRRSLRSDNIESALSETEDAPAFLSNEVQNEGPSSEPDPPVVASTEAQQPDEERLRLSFDSSTSKESSDSSAVPASSLAGADSTLPEEKLGDFCMDPYKEEPRKRRGRKKKSSGEHHSGRISPVLDRAVELRASEEHDPKEADKQKEQRPLFICTRQGTAVHEHKLPKGGGGAASAYDVYEFKDSEDEDEAQYGGSDWQVAPEKHLERHAEPAPKAADHEEHKAHEVKPTECAAFEGKPHEASGHDARPLHETKTHELRSHDASRLHDVKGHDAKAHDSKGSSDTAVKTYDTKAHDAKASEVKVYEVKAHEVKAHESQHEKRHDESKQHKASSHHEEASSGGTREYVTELSQHGKISITIRLHQKDGHDGSSASTAEVVKTSEAVAGDDTRQAPPAKQEQPPPPPSSDAHHIKTRKSARLMSQANRTTIDETIEDVVKGHFKAPEEESDSHSEGPMTRAARRTRSSRRNEEPSSTKADPETTAEGPKVKNEPPVLVVLDNKIKESAVEGSKATAPTAPVPPPAAEAPSSASEVEPSSKPESKMSLRSFRFTRSSVKAEMSKDVGVKEEPIHDSETTKEDSSSVRLLHPAAPAAEASRAVTTLPAVKLESATIKEEHKTGASAAPCETEDSDSRLSPTELIDPVTGFLTPVNKNGEPAAGVEGEAPSRMVKSQATKVEASADGAPVPTAPIVPPADPVSKPPWAIPAQASPAEEIKPEPAEAKPQLEQLQRPPVLAHVGAAKGVLQGPVVHSRQAVAAPSLPPDVHKVSPAHVRPEVAKPSELPAASPVVAGIKIPPEHHAPGSLPVNSSPAVSTGVLPAHYAAAAKGMAMASVGQPPVSLGQPPLGVWVSGRPPVGPQYPPSYANLAGQPHLARGMHPSVVRAPSLPQQESTKGPGVHPVVGGPSTAQVLCGQNKMEVPPSQLPSQPQHHPQQQHMQPHLQQPHSKVPHPQQPHPQQSHPQQHSQLHGPPSHQQLLQHQQQHQGPQHQVPQHPVAQHQAPPHPVSQHHHQPTPQQQQQPPQQGPGLHPSHHLGDIKGVPVSVAPPHLQPPSQQPPHVVTGAGHLKSEGFAMPSPGVGRVGPPSRTPPAPVPRQLAMVEGGGGVPGRGQGPPQLQGSPAMTQAPTKIHDQRTSIGSKGSLPPGLQHAAKQTGGFLQPPFAGYEPSALTGGSHVATGSSAGVAPPSGGVIAELLQNPHLMQQHKNYQLAVAASQYMGGGPLGRPGAGLHVGGPSPAGAAPQELLHLRPSPGQPLLVPSHLTMHPSDLSAYMHHHQQMLYAATHPHYGLPPEAQGLRFAYPPGGFRAPPEPREGAKEGRAPLKGADAEPTAAEGAPKEVLSGKDLLRPPFPPLRQTSPRVASSPQERVTDSPAVASPYGLRGAGHLGTATDKGGAPDEPPKPPAAHQGFHEPTAGGLGGSPPFLHSPGGSALALKKEAAEGTKKGGPPFDRRQTGLEAPLHHGPPPAHALAPPPAAPRSQPQTPPHASQVPPQGDTFLLQRYPVMWQGLLALKNDQAAVQMHFVSGNSRIAVASLPPMADGCTPPVRIAQRMRLEQTQLEGVARKMQMVDEHCILLALPCGRDHMDVLQQSNNLRNGFINYLQLKQAAGIVNAAAPGSQQPAYVIHIFPSCEFSNENMARIAPDLLHSVSDIAHLLVIIATV